MVKKQIEEIMKKYGYDEFSFDSDQDQKEFVKMCKEIANVKEERETPDPEAVLNMLDWVLSGDMAKDITESVMFFVEKIPELIQDYGELVLGLKEKVEKQ